jgi:flagellar protein FliS
MLYNEAVRQLEKALNILELNDAGKKDPGRIEIISKAIVKTQEIISELMVSLDFEQGGDIAKNLFSLYTWFNRALMEANISQDAMQIKIVHDHIDQLRTAWQEIVATSTVETVSQEMLGVNIAG